jgi:hypothetical protein
MRLFAQPVLDAPGVVSSTSKLCHYGSPQMAPALGPTSRIFGPTKLLAFRNRMNPNSHFAEAKLPHRS